MGGVSIYGKGTDLSAQHDNKNSEAEKISLENAPTSFCL
jgi:hypothetical protein